MACGQVRALDVRVSSPCGDLRDAGRRRRRASIVRLRPQNVAPLSWPYVSGSSTPFPGQGTGETAPSSCGG